MFVSLFFKENIKVFKLYITFFKGNINFLKKISCFLKFVSVFLIILHEKQIKIIELWKQNLEELFQKQTLGLTAV